LIALIESVVEAIHELVATPCTRCYKYVPKTQLMKSRIQPSIHPCVY